LIFGEINLIGESDRIIEFNQDKHKLYRYLNYFKPKRILIVFAVIFFTILTVSAQVNNTPAGIDVEVSFNEIGISEYYAYMQKNISRGDTMLRQP